MLTVSFHWLMMTGDTLQKIGLEVADISFEKQTDVP